MHRFHVPTALVGTSHPRLTGDEAVHAARVLRVRQGDEAALLDGRGTTILARVIAASRGQVELEAIRTEHTPPPQCPITLFQCIAKPKSMELIVQKATELGAAVIQPVLSERVVSKLDAEDGARKAEKWRRIAIEAMKQSGAPWLPDVRPPRSLGELASDRPAGCEWFVGSLRADARWLRDWTSPWNKSVPASVGVWVGPEGDFTGAELERIESAGAHPFTMGGAVLRSETAAVCALVLLAYELALATQSPV
jgi:16S rRNA (uracil1498-N3)-methyltransferase